MQPRQREEGIEKLEDLEEVFGRGIMLSLDDRLAKKGIICSFITPGGESAALILGRAEA